MNIYFITPFPESIKILIENNISNQGIKKELIDVNIIDKPAEELLQQNTEVESMPKTTDIQEMEEPNEISLENTI